MLEKIEIDDRIKNKNPAELFSKDIIIHVNKFDEESVGAFAKSFTEAHETDQEVIPIVINSYGGYVYSLLAMIDLINTSDRIIATVCTGKAMSCGAVLLTCGTEGYRFATPTSTVMIHDVSSMAWGKVEEMKANTKETERLNKIIFEVMEKNIGKEKGYLLDLLRKVHNSTDWYITPKQAKKLGLVNQIRVPRLETVVEVTTRFI